LRKGGKEVRHEPEGEEKSGPHRLVCTTQRTEEGRKGACRKDKNRTAFPEGRKPASGNCQNEKNG